MEDYEGPELTPRMEEVLVLWHRGAPPCKHMVEITSYEELVAGSDMSIDGNLYLSAMEECWYYLVKEPTSPNCPCLHVIHNVANSGSNSRPPTKDSNVSPSSSPNPDPSFDRSLSKKLWEARERRKRRQEETLKIYLDKTCSEDKNDSEGEIEEDGEEEWETEDEWETDEKLETEEEWETDEEWETEEGWETEFEEDENEVENNSIKRIGLFKRMRGGTLSESESEQGSMLEQESGEDSESQQGSESELESDSEQIQYPFQTQNRFNLLNDSSSDPESDIEIEPKQGSQSESETEEESVVETETCEGCGNGFTRLLNHLNQRKLCAEEYDMEKLRKDTRRETLRKEKQRQRAQAKAKNPVGVKVKKAAENKKQRSAAKA